MPTLKDIKAAFQALSENKKEELIRDVYEYSKEMKLFLESRLLGQENGEAFILEMEKETIGKVYRQRGNPQTPNGKTVQLIIARAKKERVSAGVMLELEKLAARGFIEYLNEYGGGPESFEGIAARHFEAYLKLAQEEDVETRTRLFEEAGEYLRTKDNMLRDELDDIFVEVTGMRI